MSKTLCPWQVTGNLAKNHHDMLFKQANLAKATSTVFGEGYFDLRSPAKTFRTRNLSMGNSHTTKKQPMEVKKNLKNISNFNYSFRRFHLQSDKQVDSLMPTNPSVANLLGNIDSVQNLQSAAHLSFTRERKSLPPPINHVQNPHEETLPQLSGTRANFAQPLSKSPMQNVSIMISRKKSMIESQTKTPSYMREGTALTMNADIEFSNTELPPLTPNKRRSAVRIGSYATQMHNQVTGGGIKIKQKLMQLEAQHQSPREVLQKRIIDRAVEKSTHALRAGTDLEWLKKLSELTQLLPRDTRASPYAFQKTQELAIYTPKTAAGDGSPSLRNLHERHHSEFSKGHIQRENLKVGQNQPSTFLNKNSNSSKFTLGKKTKTLFNLNDFVQETPKETAQTQEAKKIKKQRPSKHHQTVTDVPSLRISPDQTKTTQQDKFMDTQRIPFRNMKLGGQTEKSRMNSSDREQLSLEGSTANLNVKSPGKSSSKGFIQTGMTNSLIKFDRNAAESPTPDEGSPKMDQGQESRRRANLKITRMQRSGSGASDDDGSIISKDSQPKEDDDDYYDEIKLKSKLKQPRRGRRNTSLGQMPEGGDATQGNNSVLDKTSSSISKTIRTPKIYQNDRVVNSLTSFNKQQQPEEQQSGYNPFTTRTSKVSIMNVTFNEEVAMRGSNSRDKLKKQSSPYGGSSAFHQSSKRRFLRVKKLNQDLKEQQISMQPPQAQAQSQLQVQRQSGKISPAASKSFHSPLVHVSKPSSNAPSSNAADKEYTPDIGDISPLNSFQILNPKMQQSSQQRKDPIKNLNIQMQPYREPARVERLVRGSNLSIQGYKTNLENRQASPRSAKKDITESFSVKVLIQSKASRQEIFGGEKIGNDGRNSAMTVDNPDEVMNKDSDQEEELMEEHKFEVIQPKLNPLPLQTKSNKNLTAGASGGGAAKKNSKRNLNKKRKTALNSTNGGVEPWNDKEEPVKQLQSMPSLLQMEQDFDTGPVIKEQDSVEYLLLKDNSVVKLDDQAPINLNSSIDDQSLSQLKKDESSLISNPKAQESNQDDSDTNTKNQK